MRHLFPMCWKEPFLDFIIMQILVERKRNRTDTHCPASCVSASQLQGPMSRAPPVVKSMSYLSGPLTATYWEPFQDNLHRFQTQEPQSNTIQTTYSPLPLFLPSPLTGPEQCRSPAHQDTGRSLGPVLILGYGPEVGLFFQWRMTTKLWHSLHLHIDMPSCIGVKWQNLKMLAPVFKTLTYSASMEKNINSKPKHSETYFHRLPSLPPTFPSASTLRAPPATSSKIDVNWFHLLSCPVSSWKLGKTAKRLEGKQ